MFKFLEVKSNKSKKKEIITLNMITNFLKPFKLKKFKVVKNMYLWQSDNKNSKMKKLLNLKSSKLF